MTKELYGYDEEDILTLEYSDGVKEECGIIGIFGFNGKNYIALNPLGTKDVYLYGYKEYEKEYELIDITDEKELEIVTQEFERLASGAVDGAPKDELDVEDEVLMDWFYDFP